MRSCSKCGSYLPEGKVFCVSCGRPAVGVSKTESQRIRSERKQVHTRIEVSKKLSDRSGWSLNKNQHPYQGGTYEQHKSHDPNSPDYYKSKYEKSTPATDMQTRIICALAYFGIFFFLPLVALPNSEEGKFHANQGLVLFVFNLVVGVLASIMADSFGSVFEIVAVIPPLLMVNGAYNAFRGEQKELPIIGSLKLLKDNINMRR